MAQRFFPHKNPPARKGNKSMLKKLLIVGLMLAAVCLSAGESQARGRRGRGSMRRRMQMIQKYMQAYRQQMILRQQAIAKQQAAELARRRQAAQNQHQKEAEARERRKEAYLKLKQEHNQEELSEGVKPGSAENTMKNYDKNNDGVLTLEEVGKSPLSLHFKEGDADKDGKLTLEELKALNKAQANPHPKTP